MILLLAPLAPHVAEELWQLLGHDASLAREPFPVADPNLLLRDTVEIPVQVDGKVRFRVDVATGLDAAGLEEVAAADARLADALGGRAVRRVIVVPGRLVNVVTG